MRSTFLFLALLTVSLASGCRSTSWQHAFSNKVVTVSYDDLGPEALVAPVWGHGAPIPRSSPTLVPRGRTPIPAA